MSKMILLQIAPAYVNNDHKEILIEDLFCLVIHFLYFAAKKKALRSIIIQCP